jgi:hypothetical protein
MLKRTYFTLKPFCINCLYFIPHTNYPYDPLPSDQIYGKCRKFSEVDLVTGIVKYEYARVCRVDKCGPSGTQYIKKLESFIN